MKPWIVWLNYGSYEGWRPHDFETEAEAIEFIKTGCYGQPFELTRLVRLAIMADDLQEAR